MTMSSMPADKLTTDEVRTLLGVSQGTIFNHRADLRADNSTGTWLYPREAVETWQGLREVDVLDRADAQTARIDEKDLLRARLAGVITPTPPPDPRFSCRDVQRIIAWKAAGCPSGAVRDGGTAEPTAVVQATETGPRGEAVDEIAVVRAAIPAAMGEVLSSTSDGWGGMVAYLRTGDIAHIPTVWWASPTCPHVVLPADIYRTRYREAFLDPGTGRWWTAIYREGFFSFEMGCLVYQSERRLALQEGVFPWGSVPPAYEGMERQIELLVRAWQLRWLAQRLEELASLGLPTVVYADEIAAEPRDRIALEHRYQIERLRPEDLPSWYLVTAPRYLPRTNVHEYTFGQAVGGGVATAVLRSAGWAAELGQVPQPVPATIVQWAPGLWPTGQRVPWWEVQNRQFDAGAQEWSDEIAIRCRQWPLRCHLPSAAAAAHSLLLLNRA